MLSSCRERPVQHRINHQSEIGRWTRVFSPKEKTIDRLPLLFHQASDWFVCKNRSVKSEWSMLGGDAPTLLAMLGQLIVPAPTLPSDRWFPYKSIFSLSLSSTTTNIKSSMIEWILSMVKDVSVLCRWKPTKTTHLPEFILIGERFVNRWLKKIYVRCMLSSKMMCSAKELFFEWWKWHVTRSPIDTLLISINEHQQWNFVFLVSTLCGLSEFREERVNKLSELV